MSSASIRGPFWPIVGGLVVANVVLGVLWFSQRDTDTQATTSVTSEEVPQATRAPDPTPAPVATLASTPAPTREPAIDEVTEDEGPSSGAFTFGEGETIERTASALTSTPAPEATPDPTPTVEQRATATDPTATRVPAPEVTATVEPRATAQSTATATPLPRGSTVADVVLNNVVAIEGEFVLSQNPGGPLPDTGGLRILEQGLGAPIPAGATVSADWDMISITTGRVVRSTWVEPDPPQFVLGDGTVPAALSEAIVGLMFGTEFAVVYPVGMVDLPTDFDPADAYVLIVLVDDLIS